MSDSLTGALVVVRHFAEIVVQAADHDHGEALARLDSFLSGALRSRRGAARAIASTCGTVKLTVAVVR